MIMEPYKKALHQTKEIEYSATVKIKDQTYTSTTKRKDHVKYLNPMLCISFLLWVSSYLELVCFPLVSNYYSK